MSTLTISIIVVFVMGYMLIATESLTKINKAAIALLMLAACWILYMVDPAQFIQVMHPDVKVANRRTSWRYSYNLVFLNGGYDYSGDRRSEWWL